MLRHSYPCGSIFNTCEHSAVKIEESHELSRKSIENQALMVSELQKMNQFFQSRKQQQPPQQLLEPPLLEKVGPNSAVLAVQLQARLQGTPVGHGTGTPITLGVGMSAAHGGRTPVAHGVASSGGAMGGQPVTSVNPSGFSSSSCRKGPSSPCDTSHVWSATSGFVCGRVATKTQRDLSS